MPLIFLFADVVTIHVYIYIYFFSYICMYIAANVAAAIVFFFFSLSRPETWTRGDSPTTNGSRRNKEKARQVRLTQTRLAAIRESQHYPELRH